MRLELAPGDRFGQASPWVTTWEGTPVMSVGDQSVAVVVDGAGPATVQAHAVGGRWTSTPGDRAIIAIVATDDEPLFVPPARAIDARLDRTIDSWRRWSDLLEDGGPWAADVRRSALALKTLLAEATGAIAAAATTSLPEGIGGAKNWDYRYAWVRDSSFALDALINLGLNEEVHGAVSWILDAVRRNGPALHVFYSLGGQLVDGESELDIAGYRHSRPVRSGNSASGQTQLGTFGDLLDTVCRYQAEGHLLDPPTGELLADLADRCCDRWRNRDSGIWELQRREHYTISKIGCWVALDRAVRLASAGQLRSLRVERWRAEAGEIRAWVDAHCFSETKDSYTFYAGTDELDAAVLLAARTRYCTPDDPRLRTTVEAIMAELMVESGPLLYRYSGQQRKEGAFLACSCWLVEALSYIGRVKEATEVFEGVVARCNDVGLYSEEMDPGTGAMLGNIPQTLSHLAVIGAATA
ncbi:MAG: glycoside hydrolase family 15 protein, partial [Acidimicrobiales bacterium]